MKSIGVVIPWFGKLPATYTMWRKSVLYNSTIDFYLYTDVRCESEGNLHVINVTFEDFVKLLQKNFDFPISCSRPYKLCDYKPCFGEALSQLLSKYDFWGYCDMDMVFGDLRKFFTDNLLDKYDRMFITGHISLYKNNERMNVLYRSTGSYPEYNIEEVYRTNEACYFDEFRGMELKCIRNRVRVMSFEHCDYNPTRSQFYKDGVQVIAVWDHGRLFTLDRDCNEKDMVYVHIAKRTLKNEIDDKTDEFVVLPGLICKMDKDNIVSYFNISGGVLYKYRWWLNRIMKRLKSESIRSIIKAQKRKNDIAKYKHLLLEDEKNNSTI